MRLYLAIGTVLLTCCSMFAQTDQSSQAGQSTTTSSQTTGTKPQGISPMRQHMQEMQQEMQQMRSRIDKLRSDAQKVQDANTKAALLDNADMWEQFINHMQGHMDMMMKGMHGGAMGGGMMHHHGMAGAAGKQGANPKQ